MLNKFIQEDWLVLMKSNPNLHWIYLVHLLSSKQMKTRLRHQDLNVLSNSGFSEHLPHAKHHTWLNSLGVNVTYPWPQGSLVYVWLIWLLDMNRWGFFIERRCRFTKSPALGIRNNIKDLLFQPPFHSCLKFTTLIQHTRDCSARAWTPLLMGDSPPPQCV